jgi:hypothetical protein
MDLPRVLLAPLLLTMLGLTGCGDAPDDGLFGPGTAAGGQKPILPSGPATGGAGGSEQTNGSWPDASGGASGAAPTGGAAGTPGSGGSAGAPPTTPAGGQCTAMCGGQSSDGSCYCDAPCKLYGDCCADFASSCPEQANAPVGGGCTPALCKTEQETSDEKGICYCDAACVQFGDCCSNQPQVCGP